MGRLVIYSLIAIVSVVVISWLRPSGDVVNNNVTVDIGSVMPNSTTTKPFSIKNKSTKAWHVKNIMTSCGCTDISVASQVIPPGSEVDGLLTVAAPSRPGRFGVMGKIFLAESSPIDLIVRANVVSPLQVLPSSLGIVDSLEASFNWVCEDQNDDVSVVSTPTWCDVVLRSDGTGRVQVNVAPDTGVDGNVILRTSSGFLCTLRVSVRRSAFLSVTPAIVHLGNVQIGTICRSQVRISVQDNCPTTGQWDVTSGHPQLTVSQRDENGTTILDVEFRPTSSGYISETLGLKNGPLTAKVPVLARVLPVPEE